MPPRDRLRVGLDLRERPLRDDLAAVDARPGTEVHDVIGPAHRLVVVLDDDQRIALAAEASNVSSSRSLSRGCNPMVGSSST